MQENYMERINRVLLYIDEHLDNKLSLETLSQIGFYSPFHFHRLFRAVTGEALNAYIIRKRIEKIAWLLIHDKNISIHELAFQFGFDSNASLTKTFKKYFGISPSAFRNSSPGIYSKISKTNSKIGKTGALLEEYICNINEYVNFIQMNAKMEIRKMQKKYFAFTTCIGTENMENQFDKIIKWAAPKGLLGDPDNHLTRVYHDSFKITEPEKIRMSAGITMLKPMDVNGEIGITTLDPGKCLVGRFEITPQEFGKAWDSMVVWMHENGYKKATPDAFEIIYNNFREHPENKCVTDLCIPVL